jgi:hypothetical protein
MHIILAFYCIVSVWNSLPCVGVGSNPPPPVLGGGNLLPLLNSIYTQQLLDDDGWVGK